MFKETVSNLKKLEDNIKNGTLKFYLKGVTLGLFVGGLGIFKMFVITTIFPTILQVLAVAGLGSMLIDILKKTFSGNPKGDKKRVLSYLRNYYFNFCSVLLEYNKVIIFAIVGYLTANILSPKTVHCMEKVAPKAKSLFRVLSLTARANMSRATRPDPARIKLASSVYFGAYKQDPGIVLHHYPLALLRYSQNKYPGNRDAFVPFLDFFRKVLGYNTAKTAIENWPNENPSQIEETITNIITKDPANPKPADFPSSTRTRVYHNVS
jgi:hypothetical protein